MIAITVQAGPPDTTSYYHIAYAWAAVLYAGYATFLWRRSQRVRARIAAMRRGGDPPA